MWRVLFPAPLRLFLVDALSIIHPFSWPAYSLSRIMGSLEQIQATVWQRQTTPLEGLPIHHRPTARLPTTHFYTERQLQQPINQTSMKLIRDWSINTQKMLHDAIETFPLKKKRNAYFHLCITYCLIDLISIINSFQALIIIECINKNVISVYAESK